jgi:hypothetical protein
MEVLLPSYSEQKECMSWKEKRECGSIPLEYLYFTGNSCISFGMESIFAAFLLNRPLRDRCLDRERRKRSQRSFDA